MFTKDREQFFRYHKLCDLFLDGVKILKEDIGFDLDAYSILYDHVHLIITLPDWMYNYSNIIKSLRSIVTMLIADHLEKPNISIWEDKYLVHTITDPHDAQVHYYFVQYNPIQHGYVDYLGQWRWSGVYSNSEDKEIKARLKDIDELNKRAYLFAE